MARNSALKLAGHSQYDTSVHAKCSSNQACYLMFVYL